MTQDDAGSAPMRGSQPVAWAALNDDGDIAWIGYTQEAAADGSSGRAIVPLYRSPTLTDAERDVLATVRDIYASHDDDDSCSRIAAVIDGLLERTK